MKLRFFDFEVFPNWWCCTFGDHYEDIQLTEATKDEFRIVTSDDKDCRNKLLNLLQEDGVCVVGYNIKGYDLIIANAIYQGFNPQQVKIINDLIINPKCQFNSKEHMRLNSFAKKKLKVCTYQELMDDSRSGSLKDNEAMLGLDIRESDVPFDKEDLTDEDKQDILYYNKHDVWASMYFYHNVTRWYVDGKLLLGKVFNIPDVECYKSTNAILTGKVLNAQYCTFPDEFEYKIKLSSVAIQYVYDSLPSKLVDQILNNPYIFTKTGVSVKSIEVELYGNKVVFGNGGLHSVLSNNLYAESNDEYVLMNVDVASFYPSLLIKLGCLSRAIKNPDRFKQIFEERLRLKFKGNNTKEEKELVSVYKLILNTVFGASGNKYLPLYDRYQCLATCRIGQVVLAALANNIYKKVAGIKIIQTNTDGILVYVRRDRLDKFKEVCHEFEQTFDFMLEYDDCQRIWQRDVNNYLMIEAGFDGDYHYEMPPRANKNLKQCGEWLQYTINRKPFPDVGVLNGYVSTKAAIEYLVSGRPIVKTILANRNLDDFIIFCKKGPTFRGVVQKFADGTEKPVYRANRVIATKDASKGKLYKVKMKDGVLAYHAMPNTPDNCELVNNDLSKLTFDDCKPWIDYMYYIQRAVDILDIEWVDVNGRPLNRFDIKKDLGIG